MAENNQPNPVAGGSGAGRIVQQLNIIINLAAQNAAAQLAQQILVNTNVMLKQEVVKIPEYFGEKTRDTVTAQEFISSIDECQISNDWNDTTTFANIWLCL
jgi:hypothetical protein